MRRACAVGMGCCILFLTMGLVQDPLPGQEKGSTEVLEVAGRTLDQWIKDISSKDRSRGENAIRTIALFPPERAYQAVPTLLAEMKKHSSFTPIDLSIRVNLPLTLGHILGHLKDVDPKVIQEAVKQLTRYLLDDQAIVRYRAVEALGKIGSDARSSVPDIIKILTKDKSTWETRQASAQALGQVAYNPNSGPSLDVLNALYGALNDPASQVRLAAIQSLTFLGPPMDINLRQGLIKALEPVASKDSEAVVRIWGNMALMGLTDSITSDRLNIIYATLKNPEVTVRVQALQAIGTVGTKAKTAIPHLMESLADKEPLIQAWSIWALGRMGPYAIDALPELKKISGDEKKLEPLRTAAKEAAESIVGKKK